MEKLISVIPEHLTYSIGWTIFHSVWIGAIISILLFLFLSLSKESKAELRYRVSLISLSVFSMSVLFLFIYIYSSYSAEYGNTEKKVLQSGPLYLSLSATSDGSALLRADISTVITERIKNFLNSNYYIISLSWITGILILGLRFCGGLLFIRRIRYTGTSPASKAIIKITKKLKNRSGIKKCIKVVNSTTAKVPMVIGFIKPYIIIPAGMLTGIPAMQAEAIIAHELAHIKRNDFIVNIFQSLIEILLFYHPATWWISSVIRAEREVCCDKQAIKTSGDKLVYIKAIMNIGEQCIDSSKPAVALAGSDISLLNRIKRITIMKRTGFNKMEKLTSAIMSMVLLGGLLLVCGFSSKREKIDIEAAVPSVAFLEDINLSDAGLVKNRASLAIDILKPTIQDTTLLDGTIKTSFVDPEDGVNKDVEMTFKKGEVTKLIIDGKTIPASDYRKYENLIEDTREDMEEALEDIEEATEDIEEALLEIEEIDMEQINEDMQEALQQIEDLDLEKMELEIEETLYEIQEMDLEGMLEQIEEDIEEMAEIDLEMELQEIRENISNIDLSAIEEEIQKARENMRSIDFELIKEDFEKSIDNMKNFDKEKVKKEMEETLRKLEKSLEKREVDLTEPTNNKKKDKEKKKKELEQKLRDIQEQM